MGQGLVFLHNPHVPSLREAEKVRELLRERLRRADARGLMNVAGSCQDHQNSQGQILPFRSSGEAYSLLMKPLDTR